MKQINQLIKDIIPVIIGILVALLINNWNEDRKDKEYLSQILTSIEKELEESNADIKRVIPKQLASIDTINAYLNNPNISLYDIMIRANGIHMPTIKTNSWNAIAGSKIELIEYEKLSAFSDIQERKENLDRRVERQMDYTFQNFEMTSRGKKEVLMMMIKDVIGAEERLHYNIELLLKK